MLRLVIYSWQDVPGSVDSFLMPSVNKFVEWFMTELLLGTRMTAPIRSWLAVREHSVMLS